MTHNFGNHGFFGFALRLSVCLLLFMLALVWAPPARASKMKDVPNLMGKDVGKAESILKNNGFKYRAIKTPTNIHSRHGKVYRQSPRAGSPRGRTVRIWYYDAKAPGAKDSYLLGPGAERPAGVQAPPKAADIDLEKEVPIVEGLHQFQARELLAESGFSMMVGEIFPTENIMLDGQVILQEPAPDVKAPFNSIVRVTIYKLTQDR